MFLLDCIIRLLGSMVSIFIRLGDVLLVCIPLHLCYPINNLLDILRGGDAHLNKLRL